MLFPPSGQDVVPPVSVAHFVRDTISEALDLSAVLNFYNDERGYPP